MSSFTCTLTGGSQFAICNLRNLREHFLSKFRVKKVSGKTALTYTERVDTRGNVVLDLLTTFLHFHEALLHRHHSRSANMKRASVCPRLLVMFAFSHFRFLKNVRH